MIEILSTVEIDLMREAGRRAAATLNRVAALIRPGLTTAEIDAFVDRDCREQDCIPAPWGYTGPNGDMPPFPGACCTSINHVVCHGIPGPTVLKEGDIINVDVTHIYKGFHGDTSKTFIVGKSSELAHRLIAATRDALDAGIAVVKPGARLGDIGAAIQEVVEPQGFSLVTSFVGHGIGRRFHGEPNVHHVGVRGTGLRLKPGMCFTIEPMVNAGEPWIRVLDDRWTAVTADGSLSAQYEHTILVTDAGHEVLTR